MASDPETRSRGARLAARSSRYLHTRFSEVDSATVIQAGCSLPLKMLFSQDLRPRTSSKGFRSPSTCRKEFDICPAALALGAPLKLSRRTATSRSPVYTGSPLKTKRLPPDRRISCLQTDTLYKKLWRRYHSSQPARHDINIPYFLVNTAHFFHFFGFLKPSCGLYIRIQAHDWDHGSIYRTKILYLVTG